MLGLLRYGRRIDSASQSAHWRRRFGWATPTSVIEVLRTGGDHIEWIETDEPTEHLRKVVVPQALRLREAAILGDAAEALRTLDEQRLLCAHRRGPYGVRYWNHQVERWLTEATGEPIWSSWYAGRPVLVTANDYGLGLYNGDTGRHCRATTGCCER